MSVPSDHPLIDALQRVVDHGVGWVECDPRGGVLLVRAFTPTPAETPGAFLLRVLGAAAPGDALRFGVLRGQVTSAEVRTAIERIDL